MTTHEKNEVFGLSEPYTLPHVLSKLIEASNILLHDKNYDGTGWEIISHCTKLGEDYQKRIEDYLLSNNHTKVMIVEGQDRLSTVMALTYLASHTIGATVISAKEAAEIHENKLPIIPFPIQTIDRCFTDVIQKSGKENRRQKRKNNRKK